ncbi:MAG: response regulator [Rhodospirillales bacterium CG15_BIG_FIL_POST_REV_8_21_14_020_66_15]|nr:MAG: response regulator [Rhodospirillales bacterium CG15_BIG_FIL_POST_REV_8_21_14_020_66_15]
MARILVIDDESLARFTLRAILEAAGHEVVEATNGNEGIALQKADPFDLAVTDVIMPEKAGVETAIDLKRDYPDLKIIAISGGGRTRNLDFLRLAKQFGADETLAKPFSADELMALVNRLIGAAERSER